MAFRAFLDAQILVEARPRDVLLTLAEAGLFEPLWSPLVLEEMERHLPATMTQDQRSRLLAAMNRAFPDASIEWSGYVEVNVRLGVNAKDRHVVSAAVVGHADVVVTADKALFDELANTKIIDVQKLPEFIAYAIDADQPNARVALIEMAIRLWGGSGRQGCRDTAQGALRKARMGPERTRCWSTAASTYRVVTVPSTVYAPKSPGWGRMRPDAESSGMS